MSRAMGFTMALGVVCAGQQAAAAQDRVYRCGAEGHSYSQQPCAERRVRRGRRRAQRRPGDAGAPGRAARRALGRGVGSAAATGRIGRRAAGPDPDRRAVTRGARRSRVPRRFGLRARRADQARPAREGRSRHAVPRTDHLSRSLSAAAPLAGLAALAQQALAASAQAPVFRAHQRGELDPQLVAGLHALRIHRNAGHRAHLHALRLVVVAHALGAAGGLDVVVLRAERDRVVRALGLADVAVDALVGDHQGHVASAFTHVSTLCVTRSCKRLSTDGATNFDTSPPSVAISRTKVPLTNWNWSDGVMKMVSTSGISCRFMPAI